MYDQQLREVRAHKRWQRETRQRQSAYVWVTTLLAAFQRTMRPVLDQQAEATTAPQHVSGIEDNAGSAMHGTRTFHRACQQERVTIVGKHACDHRRVARLER